MSVSIRLAPPDHSGSLKGLPGIPPPFCNLLISRPFDDYRDREKRQKNDQEELAIKNRVEKVIRRLLLKAGVPILSSEQWLQSNPHLSFEVKIRMSLDESHPVFLDMQLIQGVILARDPTIKIEAVTWNYESITGNPYRNDWDKEQLIQIWIYDLIQGRLLKGIHNLVCAYKDDNRVRDSSYNTGPLNEN